MRDKGKTKEQLIKELEKSKIKLKQVEEKLKRQVELYEKMIEKANIGILIDDIEGNIKYANKKAAEIYGYSLEEMKKQSIKSLVHPDEFDSVMIIHKGRINGKKVPSNYMFKGVKKDGSIRYLRLDAAPNKKGKSIIGTRIYLRDITDLYRAEQAIQEARKYAEGIVETVREPLVVLDERLRVISANRSFYEVFKVSPKETEGQLLYDLGNRQWDIPLLRTLLEEILPKTTTIANFVVEHEFPKIGNRTMILNGRQIYRELNEAQMILLAIEDITKRLQAERKVQEGYVKLEYYLRSTISAIALIIEVRDPYTAGHQKRMAALACAIADDMGLSEKKIYGIRMTGILHDIGKIVVPAEILAKPTQLTETEFDLIKSHPQVGYDVLKDIEFPWPMAQIVLQHHERMNGSGYPQGLAGEDILLEARILAVADVVEAMCSHRPYRPALGIDRALEEISQNRGILYDPNVVDACLRLFSENKFKFQ